MKLFTFVFILSLSTGTLFSQSSRSQIVQDTVALNEIKNAYGHGDFNDAKQLLEQFILDYNVDSSAGLSYALGNIEFARRDFEAAKKAYSTSLELTNSTDPNYQFAQIGLERSTARLQYLKEQKSKNDNDGNDSDPVQFQLIEQVPIFPGCENEKSDDLKASCLQKSLAKQITREFDTEIALETGLSGRITNSCFFTINKEGKITDIKVISLNPLFEQEAIRILKTLPKMKPGLQDGKPANVSYTLPVIFNIL
ncbi:energy transducer TonB [Nonlabens antarcticus]|uniref:energy transducer TonB n=1 Tax=Nonlabens antarcticus TaxID=392714 RepID=UPI001890E075|nr:energy transducer TonB [Nonlabens antarcticus]